MKAEKFANLVNNAKNNSEAVMEILKIMKPIINKYVKKIYFMDKEDAEQELNLAIIEAIQRISNCKYDGQCIVYIENAIKFKYAHLCKSNIRREEAEGKYVEELKEVLVGETSLEVEKTIDFKSKVQQLSEKKKQILTYLYLGYTDNEIAKELGNSRQYINRVKKELFK